MSINDVDLIDVNGDMTKLSTLIKIEKMVISLPKIDCHSCSAREVEILNEYIQPKQRARIIVLSKFNNKRELKLFEVNTGLKTYEIQNDEVLFENTYLTEIPVVFLISPYLKGYCFLVDNNESSKISEKYYQLIQERFSY